MKMKTIDQNTYATSPGSIFVSKDKIRKYDRKEEITEDLWNYVYKLGIEYTQKYPNVYRDGRPLFENRRS